MSEDMSIDERLIELLSRWEDGQEQGPPLTPEDLCRDCPELLAELQARVRGLQKMKPVAGHTEEAAHQSSVPDGEAAGGQTTASPRTPSMGGSRYQPLRLHAKGGLGEVHVALDGELRRQVALKRIQQQYAHDRIRRHRFLREAEVTARLEHPGVVPVYGLIEEADGQPCYAMRFIQGDTLQEAIHRFHEADQAARDPGERRLAFRQLLNRFVAVCNTVAYAHGQGIVHRDLKPGNIMLGKYGETLVVDWGLAKPFAQKEASEAGGEEGVRPSSAGEEVGTEMGQAVGTPAYMSPEQAAGRWDLVGPASDIYSLGATLYALLTGRAPFKEGNIIDKVQRIIDRVQRGDFPQPRKVKPDVEPPLDAICLKAMSLQPEARYKNALELAADVEHWLADEPVTAYPDPPRTRLRRWRRRHKVLVAAAGVGIVLTIVSLSALYYRSEQARRQIEDQQERTESARHRTREALDATVSEVIENLLSRQGMKLEPKEEEYLATALKHYQEFAAEVGDSEEVRLSVADAHMRVSRIYYVLGEQQKAQEACQEAIGLFEELANRYPREARYRKGIASGYNNLGLLLRVKGEVEKVVNAYRRTVAIDRELVEEFPTEAEHRQHLASTQNNFGTLLSETGSPKEAEEAYRNALVLYKGLVGDFPKVTVYRAELGITYCNFGNLLSHTDRVTDAEEAYRNSLVCFKKLAADSPTVASFRADLANSHNSFAILLKTKDCLQQAEAEFREGLVVWKQLTADFPTVPSYRERLGGVHNNIGALLKRLSRLQQAEVEYREALTIRRQLVVYFPKVPSYRRSLAITLTNLANLLSDMGRRTDAELAYREALDCQRQLVVDFPTQSHYRYELTSTMVNLAIDLCDRKEFVEARELLEQAAPHHEAAINANPDNRDYRRLFRINRAVLTSTLAGLGNHAAAFDTADQLARLGYDPPDDAYLAACGLSRCIPLAESDRSVSEAKRKELAQQYADRAMAILHQAIDKGFKAVADVKEDKDIDPLRSREDFKKLLADLEKAP